MGMFDYYRPKKRIKCPVCNCALEEWQGKDADCALLIWQEGELAPINQRVDEEIKIPKAELLLKRLPHTFVIYSYDCNCPFPVSANCRCNDGVWTVTELVTAKNAVQWKYERKADFKKRLKWLVGS